MAFRSASLPRQSKASSGWKGACLLQPSGKPMTGWRRFRATLTDLAVVDPFAGEKAAREAERAIVDLGLSGLVIDSSRGGKFIAGPTVRPTLEVAARDKVPVFVHPVAHPNAEALIKGPAISAILLGAAL